MINITLSDRLYGLLKTLEKNSKNYERAFRAEKAFLNWIKYAGSVGIKEFESCINTFRNWNKEILNAFKYGYTNGKTEGYNSKIKVLKRISYGLRNFNRFRNRILHIC